MSRKEEKELVEERPSRRYGLQPDGTEWPDPTPVEIPTRLKMPQRQVDRVREVIRRELSAQMEAQGIETFQEADDFELEDEEWESPYEEVFEPFAPAKQQEPKAAPASAAGAAKKAAVDTTEEAADSGPDEEEGDKGSRSRGGSEKAAERDVQKRRK